MYKILLTFFFTIFSLSNFAQLNDRVIYLQGTIGSDSVKMILHKNVNPSSTKNKYIYSGYYYHSSVMMPIEIAQNTDDEITPGLIRIETVFDGENDIETFEGKLSNTAFKGMWMKDGEEIPFDFSVKKNPCVFAEYVTYEILHHQDYDDIRANFVNKFMLPVDTIYQNDIMKILNNGTYLPVKDFQKKEFENFKITHTKDTEAFIAKYNGDYIYQLNYEKFHTIYPVIMDENYMVLEHKNYTYYGGQHGKMDINYYTYDLKNKKRILLTDIIRKEYENDITNLLENKLREQYNIPDEDFLSEKSTSPFIVDALPFPQDYMLLKEGIIFSYDPNTIAEYRHGTIKVFLTKSELEKYLNSGFEFP